MGPNADKTLSMAGLAFIKDAEEGGKPRLTAYDDGTGTWTISYGCTRGVKKGMKITAAQAEEMLEAELAIHIAEVHRLITKPISQGLFDALVSFFFNCGSGKCPTLIKAVNGGTNGDIRRAFMLFTRAYDAKQGKTVTWPGLVKRRTAEISHWASMDDLDPKVPTPTNDNERTPRPEIIHEASHLQAASTSMPAKVAGGGFMLWMTDTLGLIRDKLPDAASEAQDAVGPLHAIGALVKVNMTGIIAVVVTVSLAVALWKLIRVQRENQILKGR